MSSTTFWDDPRVIPTLGLVATSLGLIIAISIYAHYARKLSRHNARQVELRTEATFEDERILNVAIQQCQMLELRYAPKKISWIEWTGSRSGIMGRFARPIGRDEITVGRAIVLLPRTMRGKLDSEDWRPLILSNLIYHSQLSGQATRYFLKRWIILVLGLGSILYFGVGDSLGTTAGLVLFGSLIWLLIALRLTLPLRHRLLLEADRRAADIVTRDEFLRVFTKIRNMEPDWERNLQDNHAGKKYTQRPSLTDRITNLSAYSEDKHQN